MPPLLPFLSEALYETYGMKPGEVDVLLAVGLACIVVLGWFWLSLDD